MFKLTATVRKNTAIVIVMTVLLISMGPIFRIGDTGMTIITEPNNSRTDEQQPDEEGFTSEMQEDKVLEKRYSLSREHSVDSSYFTKPKQPVNNIPLVTRAKKEWTFMVYLDADNNLEGAGIDDFLEMSAIGSIADVNIVVQMDRISGYDSSYGDWTNCQRYYITNGMTPTSGNALGNWGDGQGGREVNMGDPNTFYSFLRWGISSYPANRYAVVLWDHGSQWYGACSDDSSGGDILNMSDIDLALYYNYLDMGNTTLDLVGFDACLMASLEVTYQVWGYADHMVASEHLEPGDGWEYQWSLNWLVNNPMSSPSRLARQIVDDFVDSYKNGHNQQDDVTLSAIDFTDFKEFILAYNNLTYELYDNFSLYQNYVNLASGLVETYEDFYIDLHHFHDIINSTIVNETMNTLIGDFDRTYRSVVEYSRQWNTSDGVDTRNASGLTIYMPWKSNDYDSDYTSDPYFYFPKQTYYPDFLASYYDQPENKKPTIDNYQPALNDLTVYETQSLHFSMEASDKEGNLLSYVWFISDVYQDKVLESKMTVETAFGDAGSYGVTGYVLDGPWEGLDYGITLYDEVKWDFTVLVDNVLPEFHGLYLPASFPEDRVVNITVNATDNVELSTIWIDVDGIGNFSMTPAGGGEFYHLFNVSEPDFYNVTISLNDTKDNWNSSFCQVEVRDTTRPEADAGNDRNVAQHARIDLNGSGSTDNSGVVNYTWSFELDRVVKKLYGSSPFFTFDSAGVYNISLEVKDAWNNSDMDSLIVTVTDVTSPVANAGNDISIDQHQEAHFNGSFSSDNLGIVNFSWYFEYNDTDVNLYGMEADFIFDIAGLYNITLSVKDAAGQASVDHLLVRVRDITFPVADAGLNQTVNEGDIVTLDGSASGDNVGIVNYTWSFTYNNTSVDIFGVSPSYVFDIPGNYTVTLVVMDNVSLSGTDTVMINIIGSVIPGDDDDDTTGDDDSDDDNPSDDDADDDTPGDDDADDDTTGDDDSDDDTGGDDDSDDDTGVGDDKTDPSIWDSEALSKNNVMIAGGVMLVLTIIILGLIVVMKGKRRKPEREIGNDDITEDHLPEIPEEESPGGPMTEKKAAAVLEESVHDGEREDVVNWREDDSEEIMEESSEKDMAEPRGDLRQPDEKVKPKKVVMKPLVDRKVKPVMKPLSGEKKKAVMKPLSEKKI